jgi:hypothetical protein
MASELWAEFDDPRLLQLAARQLRARGIRRLAAHVPFEWPGLVAVLGLRRPRFVPRAALAAAVTGGTLAFLLIWWTATRDYPLDVGGRPLNSLPSDVPLIFETAVLFSAIAAFVFGLGLGGMPRLHLEREYLPDFERVSLDRFWIGVLDAPAEAGPLALALREAGALRVLRAPSTETSA